MLVQVYSNIVSVESHCLQTAGNGQQITPLFNLKEWGWLNDSGKKNDPVLLRFLIDSFGLLDYRKVDSVDSKL